MSKFAEGQLTALRGVGMTEDAVTSLTTEPAEDEGTPADEARFLRTPAVEHEDSMGFGKVLEDAGQERFGKPFVADPTWYEDDKGQRRDKITNLAMMEFKGIPGIDPDATPVAPPPIKEMARPIGWFIDRHGGLRDTSTGRAMMDCRKDTGDADRKGDKPPAWWLKENPAPTDPAADVA